MSTKRRYPTDLTDRQWGLVEPLLPSPPRGLGGRKPKHDKREIVNAILYQVRAGGAWRMLPGDLPPWQTVYGYFRDWRADGTLDRLHDALREQVRTKQEKRNPEPSAGIVDSQSVKGADTVSAATRGYDAGKKINGRKRHIVVDTIGLLVIVLVTAASIQDRDGARPALAAVRDAFPTISLIWADGGYAGKLVEWAKAAARIVVEIVRKPEGQRTFEVLPRRWVVERTLAWITKCRRLDHDYERLPSTSVAMVKWAMVGLMTRRLAPAPGRQPWTSP